jgi:hypothetical protein
VWLGEAESGLDEKFVARLFHLKQKRKAGFARVVWRARENAE